MSRKPTHSVLTRVTICKDCHEKSSYSLINIQLLLRLGRVHKMTDKRPIPIQTFRTGRKVSKLLFFQLYNRLLFRQWIQPSLIVSTFLNINCNYQKKKKKVYTFNITAQKPHTRTHALTRSSPDRN